MTPTLPDITCAGSFMALAIPAPVESQGEFMTGRVGVIALLSLLAAQEVEPRDHRQGLGERGHRGSC